MNEQVEKTTRPVKSSDSGNTATQSAVLAVWDELYKADKHEVKRASQKLTTAKQYLETRKEK